MTKGQVKWFDPKKGYGFVVGPENQDVFIHYSQIQSEGFKTLRDDEWVEYELIQSDKGWQARNVRAVAGESSPDAGDVETDAASPKPSAGGGGGYEGS